MKTRIILFVAVYQLFLISSSRACTTFVLKNDSQIVYGRNFDFNIGSGFIVNNQRGILKYAFIGSEKNLMTWESKYGSISFNQFGKEFPYGGMNETGLVIAQMYLSKTIYPDIDNRKVISPLQWIQYQLDVSSTVEEVLASDTIMRISKEVPVGIHFLVCDSEGNTATIEFINGEMVCHMNEKLPIPLLTNNTYKESISYLKQFDVLGGTDTVKWENIYDIKWTNDNTLAVNKVFATAANKMINTKDSSNIINSAFEVL
jgi:choloylglycine hydrolase